VRQDGLRERHLRSKVVGEQHRCDLLDREEVPLGRVDRDGAPFRIRDQVRKERGLADADAPLCDDAEGEAWRLLLERGPAERTVGTRFLCEPLEVVTRRRRDAPFRKQAAALTGEWIPSHLERDAGLGEPFPRIEVHGDVHRAPELQTPAMTRSTHLSSSRLARSDTAVASLKAWTAGRARATTRVGDGARIPRRWVALMAPTKSSDLKLEAVGADVGGCDHGRRGLEAHAVRTPSPSAIPLSEELP